MSGVTGPRECFREDGTCESMPRGGIFFLGEAFAGAEDITISTLLAHKEYVAKLPDNQCVAGHNRLNVLRFVHLGATTAANADTTWTGSLCSSLGWRCPWQPQRPRIKDPAHKSGLACQGAGFIDGARREGIGLQIHCIMPIMQASAQPLTAIIAESQSATGG